MDRPTTPALTPPTPTELAAMAGILTSLDHRDISTEDLALELLSRGVRLPERPSPPMLARAARILTSVEQGVYIAPTPHAGAVDRAAAGLTARWLRTQVASDE